MSYNQLTEGERYQIQCYLKAGYTQKEIADALGRSPSTISSELSRNRGLKGYRPRQAHRLATQRRLNAQKAIKVTEQVAGWVETLIRQEAAYITNQHGVSLHHETIYQMRSEEHTSELQSRGHLVCRLLLEKKKKYKDHIHTQSVI